MSAAEINLPERIDYNRHIQPILSDNCFQCHGPDAVTREAGLRLDIREEALQAHDSGEIAIVPGRSAESELLRRILSADASTVMPPPTANKQLSDRDKQLLQRWIEDGAEYHPHWAFVPPRRFDPPSAANPDDINHNPIDAFVGARLAVESLQMSPEADKPTLLRRVSLDLTGLPPTAEELEDFLRDESDDAYEKVVDRLLASPRYAERMAMSWLDLSRYADTHGYNNDGERTQWAWRDWVIHAFQSNMPYDQFIVEQVAGDLLENATAQQRLATGFGRNHVITSEGGIIEEEYRVEYVADRVHTTSTVFLGLSLQCARCHDHKFDPISQRDYYSFFAFFNNISESTLNYNQGLAAAPYIRAPSPFQLARFNEFDRELRNAEARLAKRAGEVDAAVREWETAIANSNESGRLTRSLVARFAMDEGEGAKVQDAIAADRFGTVSGTTNWVDGKFGKALEFNGQTYVEFPHAVDVDRDSPFTISAWIYPTSNEASTVVSKIDEAMDYRGFDLIVEQGKPAVHLVNHWPDNGVKVIAQQAMALNAWHHVLVTYDGSSRAAGVTIYVDGEATLLETSNDTLRDSIKSERPLHIGRRATTAPFRGRIDEVQLYLTALSAEQAKQLSTAQVLPDLAAIVATPEVDRTPAQREVLKTYYLEDVDAEYRELKSAYAEVKLRHAALETALPQTMVMDELPTPRQTFVLKRGQYDQLGDPVQPNVPSSLPPLPAGAPANRLGLAKWLVDPSNPLTARVTVNRWWQMYFGNGIVETVEDFGAQSSWPSHPELLDWLATELITSGWNVKAMQKLILMSATYRQSSHARPELIERDPKNQLLARGPRFRLPAETIRDNALLISGLLIEKLGGPSVKPYQPVGLWEDISVERSAVYKPDEGENLYRRSMYSFWKRTCPPPGLATFDAPDRETCLIRRARTNTPLQALVLMNDPTYIEAARKLAERVLLEGGDTLESKLDYAFRRAVSRNARPIEKQSLGSLHSEALERFRAESQRASDLLAVGASDRDSNIDQAELAAWSVVTSVILNLDETISKE